MKDLSGTLPKALVLLKYMAQNPKEVSFQQLKNHSGLSANVLSRILKTYIEWGFFLKDEKTGYYGLGPESFDLAKNILSSRSLQDIVGPLVISLATELEESAAFFEFSDNWVTLLCKSERPNSYHYLELMSREVHTPDNAFFACALANVPDEQRREIFETCEALKIELSAKDIKEIQELGGLVREETYRRSQITRFCAPVFRDGKLCGVIGVTILSHGLSQAEKNDLLQQCQKFAQLTEAQF